MSEAILLSLGDFFFKYHLGFQTGSSLFSGSFCSPCFYICFPTFLYLEDKPKESLNYTKSLKISDLEMENVSKSIEWNCTSLGIRKLVISQTYWSVGLNLKIPLL